jgi:hypothetical protein
MLKSTGIAVAGLIAGALVGIWAYQHQAIQITTPYQAVLLDNGQVYYGKIERVGSSYPILRDVYYVQSKVNPQTKEVTNVLIRRGSEWHSPDRMFISSRHIILIEPVGASSKVAQLISEDKSTAGGSK